MIINSFLDSSFFIIPVLLIFIVFIIRQFHSKPNNVEESMDSLHSFLNKYGHHLSHLIYLKDKNVFWAQDEKVLIMYRQIGRKRIVLGDPIGEEAHMKDAIKEFLKDCEKKKLTPVFYKISKNHLHLYHEFGYQFLKLGEEAIVHVHDFTLKGKQWAKLRTRKNKFERKGFTIQIVQPPYSNYFLSQLKDISDSWLSGRKEKSFSVGFFDEEYVSRFKIALLYNPEGEIIAFATLPEINIDGKKSIHIDLMRYKNNSPHGTMDVLFLEIFLWAKEKGYHYCSLGFAPLANVGDTPYAHLKEKMAKLLFMHNTFQYNFKGLKEYKGKFAPSWESNYLAYKRSFLPMLILQIILLVNKKPKLKASYQSFKTVNEKVG